MHGKVTKHATILVISAKKRKGTHSLTWKKDLRILCTTLRSPKHRISSLRSDSSRSKNVDPQIRLDRNLSTASSETSPEDESQTAAPRQTFQPLPLVAVTLTNWIN